MIKSQETQNIQIKKIKKTKKEEFENILEIKNLNLFFGTNQVLKNINLPIRKNRITAIIGPSGCGKSTLIRTINRISELDNAKITGEIYYKGFNLLDQKIDPSTLRKEIGMVFQKPNPFPKSIYDNVAYGPRVQGVRSSRNLNKIVKETLIKCAIWDEVEDRLAANALDLSGGQQQRLCLARALAINPEIILLDEPASALDPFSTSKIEDLLYSLKKQVSIVIVTHNMQQAARIADYTAFLYLGELIEYNSTAIIFEKPKHVKTQEYISGKFG